MSGWNAPRAGASAQPPKQMSSRLSSMKFMQRAANVDRTRSEPQTPSSEPPSKKRRTDESNPSSGFTTPSYEKSQFSDHKTIAASPSAREATEASAWARNAGGGIETDWVLNLDLPVTNGTTAQPTLQRSEEEDDMWSQSTGRQTYGSFKRKNAFKKTNRSANVENDADLSSSSDSEEDDPSSSEAGEITSSGTKKRKVPPSNYNEDAEMNKLDYVDLSKSSYARSKGAFNPGPKYSGFGDKNKHQKGGHNRSGKSDKKKKKKARHTM